MNDNQEPNQRWRTAAKEHEVLWKLLDIRGPREALSSIFAWANLNSQTEDGAISAKATHCFICAELGRLTRRMEAFEAELKLKTDDELKELLFQLESERMVEELENEMERSTEATQDSNERDAGDWWKGE